MMPPASQPEKKPSQLEKLLSLQISPAVFRTTVAKLGERHRQMLRVLMEARIKPQKAAGGAAKAREERLMAVLRDQVAPLATATKRLEQELYALMVGLYADSAAAWQRCFDDLSALGPVETAARWQRDPAVWGSLKGRSLFGLGFGVDKQALEAMRQADLPRLLETLVTAYRDRDVLESMGLGAKK